MPNRFLNPVQNTVPPVSHTATKINTAKNKERDTLVGVSFSGNAYFMMCHLP